MRWTVGRSDQVFMSLVITECPLINVDVDQVWWRRAAIIQLSDVLVTSAITPRRRAVGRRAIQRHRCHDDATCRVSSALSLWRRDERQHVPPLTLHPSTCIHSSVSTNDGTLSRACNVKVNFLSDQKSFWRRFALYNWSLRKFVSVFSSNGLCVIKW